MSGISGTITFLFTDIEGSTVLWASQPAAMAAAVEQHDEIVAAAMEAHGGTIVKSRGEGDSHFCVFRSAVDAVAAACELQISLSEHTWPGGIQVKLRVAVHTGEAQMRDGDYYGGALSRCARLRSIAHGGQTLLSGAAYELTQDSLPPGVVIHDLGAHRLKDLERSEHVYQITPHGVAAAFPPLRSLNALPNNLPQQLTSFIGRGDAIAEVQRLLFGTRLLTIKGVGGCGKTRLALQVAADVLEQYPDGVWLVELAPISDAANVPRAVAATLGIREQPGIAIESSLIDHLESRTLLLVLDNCEHLAAACAKLAVVLLSSCRGLRVLTTSRDPILAPGETVWEAPPLSLPRDSHSAPPHEVAQFESIRLFVERAGAVRSHFALDGRNASVIAQICRRVDGLPFAIELAAAQVASLTVEEIAEHLFTLLGGDDGRAAVPDRHRTVFSLMDWSYDLLQPAEQELFRSLAVFAGGCTLKAVTAVQPAIEEFPGRVLRTLSRLVRASLVAADQPDAETRYRLLETVREYAILKLSETGELDAVRDRHVRYFVDLAEEAEPNLGGREQRRYAELLRCEEDNLRSAYRWAAASDQRLRLSAAVWRYWVRRSNLSECRAWLEGALARGSRRKSPYYPRAMTGLGAVRFLQGDYGPARAALHEALELFTVRGDERGRADALNSLGSLASEIGEPDSAEQCFAESLDIRRKLGDMWGSAAALNNLAGFKSRQGDLDAACELYEESLGLYQDLGDAATRAVLTCNLGGLLCQLHRFERARELLEYAASQLEEVGDKRALALALNNLGEVHIETGDLEAARRCSLQSLEVLTEIGELNRLTYGLETLGKVEMQSSGAGRAIILLAAADGIRTRTGRPSAHAEEPEAAARIEALRADVGAQSFDEAWQRGRGMSAQEAVAFSRNEKEH